jgi:phage gpG-like protein
MAFTGDFEALRRLKRQFYRLQTAEWRQGLAANLGEEALSQVEEGFARERDPYGRPWPKSMRASLAGGQTLTQHATLRRSFSRRGVRATPGGFTIGTAVRYAWAHQRGVTIRPKVARALSFRLASGQHVMAGSVTIPKRMMIPEGRLGPIWSRAFEDAASAYVRETFG